jgi:hypothetical protein
MKRKKHLRHRAAWEVRETRPQVETVEVTAENWRDLLAGRYGPYIIAPNAARTKLIATKVPEAARPAVAAYVKSRFERAR